MYYDTNQLAEMLGMAPVTLQRWRAEGTGPDWIKVGGFYRYPRAEFERWYAENMAVA